MNEIKSITMLKPDVEAILNTSFENGIGSPIDMEKPSKTLIIVPIKQQPPKNVFDETMGYSAADPHIWTAEFGHRNIIEDDRTWVAECPFGAIGSTLIVKEGIQRIAGGRGPGLCAYLANGGDNTVIIQGKPQNWMWKTNRILSADKMPMDFARIKLKTRDIYVRRLQNVKYYEMAEFGLHKYFKASKDEFEKISPHLIRLKFWGIWNKIYKNEMLKVQANPWVWIAKIERNCEN